LSNKTYHKILRAELAVSGDVQLDNFDINIKSTYGIFRSF